MVFYQEVEADSDDSHIDSGDLVYWRDVNTNVKIYETVDKVINKDGELECQFVETEESEGGHVYLSKVTLVAKKKDRKDI